MTKEEQIEEMTSICYVSICHQIGGGDFVQAGDRRTAGEICAEELYKSGYRKADEVRKETAQKVIKPYQHERFGKNGQTYSLKCGRCNKTVQTKWNYCPFCGTKLREVEE